MQGVTVRHRLPDEYDNNANNSTTKHFRLPQALSTLASTLTAYAGAC